MMNFIFTAIPKAIYKDPKLHNIMLITLYTFSSFSQLIRLNRVAYSCESKLHLSEEAITLPGIS